VRKGDLAWGVPSGGFGENGLVDHDTDVGPECGNQALGDCGVIGSGGQNLCAKRFKQHSGGRERSPRDPTHLRVPTSTPSMGNMILWFYYSIDLLNYQL